MAYRSWLATILAGVVVVGLVLGSVLLRAGANVSLAQPAATAFGFSPHFVCGRATESDPDNASLRPGIYATHIDVLNYTAAPATVQGQVILLAWDGSVQGRDPRTQGSRAQMTLQLPANSATTIDCPRLLKLLDPVLKNSEGLAIGFIDLVSATDLNIEVVHTAEGRDGSLSISTEMVPSKPVPAVPIATTTATSGTATAQTTATAETTATSGTATAETTATSGTATAETTATSGTATAETTATSGTATAETTATSGTVTATAETPSTTTTAGTVTATAQTPSTTTTAQTETTTAETTPSVTTTTTGATNP